MTRVEELRRLLAEAPESVTLAEEPCDCGGDYPCGHGVYAYGLSMPDGVCITEVGDLPPALLALIAAAPEALRDLLDVYEAARELADAEDQADFAAMTRVMDALRAALARLEGTP